MSRNRKTHWPLGAIFAVALPDGTFALGQAISMMMANVVYCALTDRSVSSIAAATSAVPTLTPKDVVARVALTREQLDYAAWPVVGVADPLAAVTHFTNERFAATRYVGATMYDAVVAQDFLAAFHALAPWDDWFDPDFLDAWLVSPDRKPAVLLFKSGRAAT
jgi:hypothetical protein